LVAQHFNGAIRVVSAAPVIHSSTIRDNLSVGILATQADRLQIVDSIIRNNRCESCNIAGIEIQHSDDVTLERNELTENVGGIVGGLFIGGGSGALISENSIARNRIAFPASSGPAGAGILLEFTEGTVMTQNVVVANEGDGAKAHAVAIRWGQNIALMNNKVESNATAYALTIENVVNASFQGDKIIDNVGHGIRFIDSIGTSSNVTLSADPFSPTVIAGNGGHEIFNDQQFELMTDPLAAGNVDARNVWWGTTDISQINAGVLDFFDDSFRGIVFVDPFASAAPSYGEFIADGLVNSADYAVWRDGLGVSFVQGHYDLWKTRFGKTVGDENVTTEISAVSEPSTLLITVAAILAMRLRRSKHPHPIQESSCSLQLDPRQAKSYCHTLCTL
jgi:parallel beta-helix repeat protein